MKQKNKYQPAKTLLALSLASLLAACGGSDTATTEKKDDTTVTIDTAGRLAIAEKDSKNLILRDLDNHVTEATHQLDNAGAGLQAKAFR